MIHRNPSEQEQATEQLLLACENADLELFTQALENGGNLEERNQAGESAMHLAVKSGNADMVNFLIHNHRINVNLKDAFGRTPLHWAAQQGNVPIVETLLLAHASVGAKDDMGVEPKIYAEMAGHKELVTIFSLVRSTRK